MASEKMLSIADDVMKQHGTIGLSDIDLASRREEEAARRRSDAAGWLRRTVGVVIGKDLPEQPSEEEFKAGLRNGIILCNAFNKVYPNTIPKVVEAPSDTSIVPDGAALSAFQYFENLRNFLVALEDKGLPTFEASDLEKGGKGSRVVDSVLALKSCSESKQIGKKYGGISKPISTGLYFFKRNAEAFMSSLTRSQSLGNGHISDRDSSKKVSIDTSQMKSIDSLNMLVRSILSDKKPEEIPQIVESMLSRVIQEFDRHVENENELVKPAASDASVGMESVSKLETETVSSEFNVKPAACDAFVGTESVSKVETESVSSESKKMDEVDNPMTINQQAALPNEEKSQKCVKMLSITCDKQQQQIEELKHVVLKTKADMELMKSKHIEEFKNLGEHLNVVASAASGYKKVLHENRKLYNQIQDLKGNIRIYCRVRPFLPGQQSGMNSIARIDDGSITIIVPSKNGKESRKSFNFNKVFGSASTQKEVFSDTQPLIRSVLDGYNVCIFAYGQTGSGKTYTMSGPNELNEQTIGVNYRALNDLFYLSEQRKDTFHYEISVQMIEIYNEQVRDLLDSDNLNKRLEIRNSSQTGINVPDANVVSVASPTDVINLMNLGQKNRAVCSTAMNDRSSRSHSCLTIHVQGKDITSGAVLRGTMHLVDLAGSERVDKSEVKGDRLKEAQHINKSLSALGDVIASLAQKNSHVPYRNSKLTQLLQDSLGGQAKTLMFVNISPEMDAVGETLSTLKFAERVATVELGSAKLNKDNSEVKELKEQIANLKAALARKEIDCESASTISCPDVYKMKSGMELLEEDISDTISNHGQQLECIGNLGRSHSAEEVCNGDWVDNGIAIKDDDSLRDSDSDDSEIATTNSETDSQNQYSHRKTVLKNGARSTLKNPKARITKSTDIRTVNHPHVPSTARKASNGLSQTPNRVVRPGSSGNGGGVRRTQSNGKMANGKR